MKLLQMIPSLNPDLGGVVAAVRLASDAMRANGHRVVILTLDDPSAPWLNEMGDEVIALGPVQSHYGYSPGLVPWLKSHVREYDAVLVNGLWQYVGFAAWRALSDGAVPYFVFPHGMLDPWFKHAYPFKHLKKWLYWPWAEYRVLRDARRVIFTCEEEQLLSRQSFWLYKAKEEIVSLGVPVPPQNADELAEQFVTEFPEVRGKRLLLFLSRIHPIKGCDLLLESFACIAKKDSGLHLVMAGPDQVGWVAKLKARAIELGIANRVSWPGMLVGDLKWGAFYASDAFCLPSHHENFGMVVAEALACGKPVLISNKVQIWRDIEAAGAGLVSDDTLQGISDLLLRWYGMDHDSMRDLQANALNCYRNRYDVRAVAERLVKVIQQSR